MKLEWLKKLFGVQVCDPEFEAKQAAEKAEAKAYWDRIVMNHMRAIQNAENNPEALPHEQREAFAKMVETQHSEYFRR